MAIHLRRSLTAVLLFALTTGCDVRVPLGSSAADDAAIADASGDSAASGFAFSECDGCPWLGTLDSPGGEVRNYGRSLAGNDEFVAIGASGSAQVVFVYRVADLNRLVLEPLRRLTAPSFDSSGLFGRSVALSRNYLLVGSGEQVHLYRLNDLNSPAWTFRPPDPADLGFGYSVAAFGNQVQIGQHTSGDGGLSWLHTYFDLDYLLEYERADSNEACRQPSLTYTDQGFGIATCDDDNSLIIERHDDEQQAFEQIGTWEVSRPDNHELGAVASSDDIVAIAWHPTASRGGSIQFLRAGPTWFWATPGPSRPGPQDEVNNSFGLDVAMVGRFTLVAASTTQNAEGAEVGAIYIYEIPSIE